MFFKSWPKTLRCHLYSALPPLLFFFFLISSGPSFLCVSPGRTNQRRSTMIPVQTTREKTPCQKLHTVGPPLPDRQSCVCVSVKLFCDLFSYYPFPPFSPFHPHDDDKSCSIPCYNKALADCSGWLCLLSPGSIPSLSLCGTAEKEGKRKKKGSSSCYSSSSSCYTPPAWQPSSTS